MTLIEKQTVSKEGQEGKWSIALIETNGNKKLKKVWQ